MLLFLCIEVHFFVYIRGGLSTSIIFCVQQNTFWICKRCFMYKLYLIRRYIFWKSAIIEQKKITSDPPPTPQIIVYNKTMYFCSVKGYISGKASTSFRLAIIWQTCLAYDGIFNLICMRCYVYKLCLIRRYILWISAIIVQKKNISDPPPKLLFMTRQCILLGERVY